MEVTMNVKMADGQEFELVCRTARHASDIPGVAGILAGQLAKDVSAYQDQKRQELESEAMIGEGCPNDNSVPDSAWTLLTVGDSGTVAYRDLNTGDLVAEGFRQDGLYAFKTCPKCNKQFVDNAAVPYWQCPHCLSILK